MYQLGQKAPREGRAQCAAPPTAGWAACVQECHCMLFLTEDNDFAGREQNITLQEVEEMTQGM